MKRRCFQDLQAPVIWDLEAYPAQSMQVSSTQSDQMHSALVWSASSRCPISELFVMFQPQWIKGLVYATQISLRVVIVGTPRTTAIKFIQCSSTFKL